MLILLEKANILSAEVGFLTASFIDTEVQKHGSYLRLLKGQPQRVCLIGLSCQYFLNLILVL